MDDKLLLPVIMFILRVLDMSVKVLGEPAAEKLLCKIGKHKWQNVEGEKFKQYCTRCRIVDDVRTSGIDNEDSV